MTYKRLTTVALALGALVPAVLSAQQPADSVGPSAISYKGVKITPIGFFAAEAFWRQRNENADVGSSFNAIPFNNSANGQLSEFRMSARQSRIGMLAEGQLSKTKLTGYWESDFLSSGTTSNSNESNSYTFRLRQIWGQAAFSNGVALSAGQMWSFLTTSKSGLNPRKEASPLTIDAQYVAGFDWARQAAVRLTSKLGKTASWGIALEEPQAVITQHGANANYISSQAGGSQLNATTTYSSDLAPDAIVKFALDPKFGHYELKLIGRVMRDRMYDSAGTAGGGVSIGHNDNEFAGGVGVGAWWSGHAADFGLSGLWGRGIGRYGTSQLADATVDSTGKLVPIHAAHALASLELHTTPKLDIYMYAGGEYEDRTASVMTTSTGAKGVGYGSPLFVNGGCNLEFAPSAANTIGTGSGANACTGDTRAIYQGALGYWYRFYKGPAGVMQWGLQYSYTARNTWSGVNGVQPKATENMAFTSIRYYIP